METQQGLLQLEPRQLHFRDVRLHQVPGRSFVHNYDTVTQSSSSSSGSLTLSG